MKRIDKLLMLCAILALSPFNFYGQNNSRAEEKCECIQMDTVKSRLGEIAHIRVRSLDSLAESSGPDSDNIITLVEGCPEDPANCNSQECEYSITYRGAPQPPLKGVCVRSESTAEITVEAVLAGLDNKECDCVWENKLEYLRYPAEKADIVPVGVEVINLSAKVRGRPPGLPNNNGTWVITEECPKADCENQTCKGYFQRMSGDIVPYKAKCRTKPE